MIASHTIPLISRLDLSLDAKAESTGSHIRAELASSASPLPMAPRSCWPYYRRRVRCFPQRSSWSSCGTDGTMCTYIAPQTRTRLPVRATCSGAGLQSIEPTNAVSMVFGAGVTASFLSQTPVPSLQFQRELFMIPLKLERNWCSLLLLRPTSVPFEFEVPSISYIVASGETPSRKSHIF